MVATRSGPLLWTLLSSGHLRAPLLRALNAGEADESLSGRDQSWQDVRAALLARHASADGLGSAAAAALHSRNGQPPQPPTPLLSRWWVHELANPEPGCLLLAQPHTLPINQPMLKRAVILVLEHDATEGTVGLLLERTANATVAELLARRPEPALSPLAENVIHIGGVVLGRRRLRALTRRCDVPGSRQVVPGLFECEPAAAAKMVAIGAATADSFEVYAAALQWSPSQLSDELSRALWLPVAASAAAITGEDVEGAPARGASASPHALYFQLIEAVGGEYARQALLSRSTEEVDDWLMGRTAGARLAWQQLAARLESRRVPLVPVEEAAFAVHSALLPLDNLTDVRLQLDSLSEQASYIWFTREMEAGSVVDSALMPERPVKDPSFLLPTARGGRATLRRRGEKMRPGSLFPSTRQRARGNRAAAAVPPVRVVSAAAARAGSQENGAHAINLLLFDLLNLKVNEAGTPEQTSLPTLVRRSSGATSLLTMCILYAALARRIGIAVEIVRFVPPPIVTTKGPSYFIRLRTQSELYVDLFASGRLRTLEDLASYAVNDELASASPAQLRSMARPLEIRDVAALLIDDRAAACSSANQLSEAAFWNVQGEVLRSECEMAARSPADSGPREG